MRQGYIVALLALVLLVGGILVGCGDGKEDTAEWRFEQGNKLYDQGRYDEAVGEYTVAILLDPEFALAYYNRGLAYEEQGKKAEAIADFEKLLTLTDNPQLREMAREQIEELSE